MGAGKRDAGADHRRMGSPPVVIVGAGPAGAGLALLLASRGLAVTLVERQLDFAREFRGEAMTPSGLAALAAMGVDVERSGIAHARPTELEIYVERRLAFRVDAAAVRFDGPPPMMVSQPPLLEHLVAQASQHAGFRFLRGAAVRDLLPGAGGRVAGVRVATPAGEETLEASLVVGADGRASIVRRRGGFTAHERDTPLDVVWTRLPWPESWSSGAPARAYLAGGHLLLVLPAPGGGIQLAWIILKGTYGELRSRGTADWVREMATHASGDLAPHLRANAERETRPFLLSAATDRVTGWARPGALLIGDAAHTMSPVGGQGINLALRDAIVAANRLVPALRAGAGPAGLDEAAASIEAERGPEIDRIQTLASQPPRVVLGRGWLARLARRALPLALRLPLSRAAAARTAGVFLYGVTDVRLVV
jgi:2-polyprenyl-6-methoxyphenol hydroxylase-like FAD-dependent oxidoreductase